MKINRILVIDDDASVTREVKSAIGRHGPFHVREERDLARASTTAQSYRPDLIILNMDPPCQNRHILAKELEFAPVLQSVPIMRVSGPAPGAAPGGLALAKPLDAHRLAELIYDALARRTTPPALS